MIGDALVDNIRCPDKKIMIPKSATKRHRRLITKHFRFAADTEEMSESADDEFCVECSDDENYGLESIEGECCHPAPDQLTKLMQELTQKAYLEIKWECTGRKSPSDFAAEDADLCDEIEDAVNDIEEPEKCKEFDFDDFSDNPRFAPRRNLTNQKLKGSGQRRVANFSSVVSNMRRHMKKDTFEMKKNNTENAKKRLLFSSGVKL